MDDEHWLMRLVMCEAARNGRAIAATSTYNLSEAEARLAKKKYDVVVTDLLMDGRRDGLEVLHRALALAPPPPVILVTAHADIPTCRQALNEGRQRLHRKPLDLEYFRAQENRAAEKAALQKQNQALAEQLIDTNGFEGIIGKSGSMQEVVRTARQIAASDIPVLIMEKAAQEKDDRPRDSFEQPASQAAAGYIELRRLERKHFGR